MNLREWLTIAGLGFIAGILVMALNQHVKEKDAHRRRGPIGMLLRAVLGPLWWWFGLNGPDGKPSHSRIAYMFTLAFFLAGWVNFGLRIIASDSKQIDLSFVMLTLVVGAYALGSRMFSTLLQTKLGGLAEKAGEIAAAQVEKTKAEVAARRAAGVELGGVEPAL